MHVARFDEAVASFRESSHAMNGAIGGLNLEDHTLRARAGETARDVFGFCHTFRRLYQDAHSDLRKDLELVEMEFASRPGEDAGPEEWGQHAEKWMNLTRERDLERFEARTVGSDATTALILGFKVLYLFVRAHQDSLCALVHLALFPQGTLTGSYNMTQHLDKPRGPVGEFVREAVPDYEDWYRAWRAARNRVKEGVSFATYGSHDEMGIRFTFIPEGGGVMVTASEGVSLPDVVRALEMSDRLHRAITARAISRQTELSQQTR